MIKEKLVQYLGITRSLMSSSELHFAGVGGVSFKVVDFIIYNIPPHRTIGNEDFKISWRDFAFCHRLF